MATDFSKYSVATKTPDTTDFSKYGTPLASSVTTPAPTGPAMFGNPLEDIQNAGEDVFNAITGQDRFAGKNSLERGFRATEAAALAIPTVAADVLPYGRTALDAVGSATGAAVQFAGDIHNKLADVATKIGLMTPEQRAQYDQKDIEFATSPLGIAIDSAASVGEASGNIANVILAAHGTAQTVDKVLTEGKNALQRPPQADPTDPALARQQEAVSKVAETIKKLEDSYAKTRNANDYSKDGGVSSRERIAQSGVLRYAVDENGLLRTTDKGGAVDQYRSMTVQPAEGVVRKALQQEGNLVNLSEVQAALEQQVRASGLKGADLISALNYIKREIQGLRLEADAKGYVPNTLLHDAKINTTSNINFNTPAETATIRKAIARGYKTLVENNSSFNVAEVNAELAKFYDDIARLERLDGTRVQGAKMGRYFAQITGNIVGSAFGSLFGPYGAATGAIVGGEVSGFIKSKTMQGAFDSSSTPQTPQSPVLQKAVADTTQ